MCRAVAVSQAWELGASPCARHGHWRPPPRARAGTGQPRKEIVEARRLGGRRLVDNLLPNPHALLWLLYSYCGGGAAAGKG